MASAHLRARLALGALRSQAQISVPRPRQIARRPVSTTATPAPISSSSLPTTAAPFAKHTVPHPQGLSRARSALWFTSIGLSLVFAYLYVTDTRAAVHRWVVPRLLRVVYPDAEDAHHAGTQALRVLYELGLNPRDRTEGRTGEAAALATRVFGPTDSVPLNNPIGISAGLDKDAEIPDALFALGAAVVEVGGCTPRPQAGNPRPRLFRVPAVEGLVNRYGLNSIGADALAGRLHARLRHFCHVHGLAESDVLSGAAGVPVGSLAPGRLLLVQIAKNKDTDEHDVRAVAEDYAYCVRRLAPYADVLVVNVSSPNTPGLRDLQAVEPLTRILGTVVDEARKATVGPRAVRTHPPRVMVKVSPDEDEDEQIDGICEAVWASGVDGIIVGNTTKRRTGLVPTQLVLSADERQALGETGGFSGPAMIGRTVGLVRRYRSKLDQQALHLGEAGEKAVVPKTLFASGGVISGTDALDVLNAGASVAMLYSSLVYGGCGTVTRIKKELLEAQAR